VRALNSLRSRLIAGSVALGTLGLALGTPAQALQKIETASVSGAQNTSPTITFPLFRPFDPALGKELVLTGVTVSLTGNISGTLQARHNTATNNGSLSALSTTQNLLNWFGQSGATVPDQAGTTKPFTATVNGSSPLVTVGASSGNNQLNSSTVTTYTLTASASQTTSADSFDLTPYLSYFIGTGTGTTDLALGVEGTFACTTGSSCWSSFPYLQSGGSFQFSGTNNFSITYDYYVYEAPGPLPIAGGVAAFGWSRRLRRRIRDARRPLA